MHFTTVTFSLLFLACAAVKLTLILASYDEQRRQRRTISLKQQLRGVVNVRETEPTSAQLGEEWLVTVKRDLADFVSPVVSGIVDKFEGKPVIIKGSWPAKQIADARIRSGFPAPKMVANDIDVNYPYDDGEARDVKEEYKPVYNTIKMEQLVLPGGREYELNTLGVTGLNWEAALNHNDIDATGVVVEAYRDTMRNLIVKFHVSSAFWDFLLSDRPVIRPIEGAVRNSAQTMVRVAFKAFQMNLDFDVSSLDPTTGTIADTHVAKIAKMRGWSKSPFPEDVSVTPVSWVIS